MSDSPAAERSGLIVIQRLQRLVRHGYRPWLGYDVASGQDQTVHLRRKDGNATLHPDGAIAFASGAAGAGALTIAGDDAAGFDRRFPPNTPNKRNLLRRLYEIGV